LIDYNKRLVEVDVILNHLKESDYNKIPKKIIEIIKQNKDKEYIWNYDETKELKEQNVSKDTFAIVSYINTNYLLNEQQKNFVEKLYKYNQQKLNNIKKEKYNVDNIFNKKNEVTVKGDIVTKENMQMLEYKESFFRKIINKILKFFNRK
jgi:hypothetical protein